jgi:hypothetical protein
MNAKPTPGPPVVRRDLHADPHSTIEDTIHDEAIGLGLFDLYDYGPDTKLAYLTRRILAVLADAGLLLTDADRAVLDAAEAWAAGGRAPKVPSFGVGAYPTEMVLARAVRARREATS